MKTALITIALTTIALMALLAADPQQPKVGPTPVINATNGYGGTLTVRTQLNVGYVGQQGTIAISPPDTNLTATITVDTNGTIQAEAQATNAVLKILNNNANSLLLTPLGSLFLAQAPTVMGLPDTYADLAISSLQSVDGIGQSASDFNAVDSPGFNYFASFDSLEQAQTNYTFAQFQLRTYDPTNVAGIFGIVSSTDRRVSLVALNENGDLWRLFPTRPNGELAYLFDTSVAHTGGNLMEVKNNGSSSYEFASYGELDIHDPDDGANAFYGAFSVDFEIGSGSGFINIHNSDGQPIISLNSDSPHTSGNLAEFKNNGTMEGDLTHDGLWEGRAFGATSGSRIGNYYAAFTELNGPDTDYGVNDISLDMSTDGNPALVMLSTGETTSTIPYVNFRPAQLGASWSLGSVPFMLNTRTNISTGNMIFGLGNNETNVFSVLGSGAAQTTVPSGGTNAVPFKIGEHVAGTFSLVTTNAVLIEINGVTYKLATVQ